MANNPRRANGSRRDKIIAYWRSQGQPCALCHLPIDYSAPYWIESGRFREDGTPIMTVNPDAFVVDEIVPVSRGGSPFDRENTQPAHARCNSRKGNKMQNDSKIVLIARSLTL